MAPKRADPNWIHRRPTEDAFLQERLGRIPDLGQGGSRSAPPSPKPSQTPSRTRSPPDRGLPGHRERNSGGGIRTRDLRVMSPGDRAVPRVDPLRAHPSPRSQVRQREACRREALGCGRLDRPGSCSSSPSWPAPRGCRVYAERRSCETGTKRIRSTASSGGLVISTMAMSGSRSSSPPPRAPAGTSSTRSESSTLSNAAISCVVAIRLTLGSRVGRDQPRGRTLIRDVPRRDDGCGAAVDFEPKADLADESVLPAVPDRGYGRSADGEPEQLPYPVRIVGPDSEHGRTSRLHVRRSPESNPSTWSVGDGLGSTGKWMAHLRDRHAATVGPCSEVRRSPAMGRRPRLGAPARNRVPKRVPNSAKLARANLT